MSRHRREPVEAPTFAAAGRRIAGAVLTIAAGASVVATLLAILVAIVRAIP